MQGRLPGLRRRRDVQGRVPLPLLRGPAPAPERVRLRPGLPVGEARVRGAGTGQLLHANAAGAGRGEVGGRDGATAADPGVRAPDVPRMVPTTGGAQPGDAAGAPLAGHLQQPLLSGDRAGGGRGAGGGRVRRRHPRPPALLRAAVVRLRDAGPGRAAAPADPGDAASGARGRHARDRSRAELRGGVPRRAPRPHAGR